MDKAVVFGTTDGGSIPSKGTYSFGERVGTTDADSIPAGRANSYCQFRTKNIK